MKPVPGYPGYFATEDGEIVSMRSGEARTIASRPHGGYLHVRVKVGKGREAVRKVPVHSLVLSAYEGPKPGPDAVTRHLNGDARDNRPANLRWGTPRENAADAMRHGTAVCLRRGDAHNRTRISTADVVRIRTSNLSDGEVAASFGVSALWIRRIRAGRARIAA